MISRRGFLTRLIAAPIVALTVLRTPIEYDWLGELRALKAADQISMRYVEQFDIATTGAVNRLDVLYGFATFQPDFVVRITDELPWWNSRRWL